MTVSRNDVNDMASIIAAMNGGQAPAPRANPGGGAGASNYIPAPITPNPAGDADAMRSILESFYNVNPQAAAPVRPPQVTPQMRQAAVNDDPFAYTADPMGGYDPYAFNPNDMYGSNPVGDFGEPDQFAHAVAPALEEALDDPVMALLRKSQNNPELAEALVTERTERGTRVGSWEIVEAKDERGLSSYSVVSVRSGEAIATDLTLYEAAHGIVRQLNAGKMINSHKVREILNVEAEYARFRQNAAEARDRAKVYERRGDSTRAALMEDRFDAALGLAKSARARLSKIVK